ncbi:unnamed protein product [Penicillium camemberti]|uniref:Str. FM013 n=1 Tax=Penicillium camemberti (strain FM 013) TaxID=1429867 RepID=A0A0G4PKT8_PENC3|nr:unnamed protein product [Penicillium camemberti]
METPIQVPRTSIPKTSSSTPNERGRCLVCGIATLANDGVIEHTKYSQDSQFSWDHIVCGNCYQIPNVSLLRKAKTGTGVGVIRW